MNYISYIFNKIAFLSEKLQLMSLCSIRTKVVYHILKESEEEQEFQLITSKEEL
ncbi:MAG: hypothetical protein ACOYEG_06235 [Petrimonas sp.]